MLLRTKNLLDYDRYLKLILINTRKNKRYLMELTYIEKIDGSGKTYDISTK